MSREKTIGMFLGVAFVFSLAPTLEAQSSNFYGDFLLGYRYVNKSGPGANYKYREDYNLRSGARLTNFTLSFSPDNGLKKFFDRLDIRMYNLGGDPYENITVAMQKYGKYLIQYDRNKSTYFYHDLNLGDGGIPYDLYRFDFDRVRDTGLAKVWLTGQADLYLSFDRYTKKGDSRYPRDIERLEFQMTGPIQEESKEAAVGLDLHFNRYSFIFEEKFLNSKIENRTFLPGYLDGGPNAEFPTALYYYFLNEPYEIKSNTSSFRFNARPISRLFLSGSAQLTQLDLNLDYSERAKGVNYLDRYFQYDITGTGKFERNFQLYGLDVSYNLFDNLSIVGAFRYHNFDQTDSLEISGETESQDFGYKTLGVDAGVQYQFSPKLAMTLGYRYEDRNLDNLETVTFEFDTVKNGGFGNLKWDVSRALKLTVDYERSQYTDPFTLISPTAFDRLRITARYQANNLSISGSYLWNNSKSEVFEDIWRASKNQFNLRLGYHVDRFNASGGFAYIQAKRQGNRTVSFPPWWTGPGGTFLWEILYEGKSSLLDGLLSYDLDKNWKLGGYANYYSNTGSWETRRTVLKAFVEYAFTAGYVAQVGYRFVDYKEIKFGYSDYKANIVEFAFGYRWK